MRPIFQFFSDKMAHYEIRNQVSEYLNYFSVYFESTISKMVKYTLFVKVFLIQNPHIFLLKFRVYQIIFCNLINFIQIFTYHSITF